MFFFVAHEKGFNFMRNPKLKLAHILVDVVSLIAVSLRLV